MLAISTRKTPLSKLYGRDQKRYLELLARFPLRRIRSEVELDAATEVIHELIDRETRTPAEEDYLDVLSDIVEKYETVHYPMRDVTDGEMLKYLLEVKSVTQVHVAEAAGIAESTISEVLSGKRKLNRAQIGKLARYFNVEPGVFAFDE